MVAYATDLREWKGTHVLSSVSAKLAILLAAMIVTGCSLAPSAGPQSSAANVPDKVVVALSGDALGLDATSTTNLNSRIMYTAIYDPLISSDAQGNLEPRLAEKWERLNDTTWRIYLRKGVKFQNGEAFNSASVKFSLDRYRDPKISASGGRYGGYESVKIVDDYTVDVVLKTPDALFLPNVANFLYMVPPKYYSEHDSAYINNHPVGTGPYVFKEWMPGDHATFTANADYYRGAPKIQTITFRIIADPLTRVAALLSGEVDIVQDLPPDQIATLSSGNKATLSRLSGPRTVYLGLKADGSTPAPALADKRVRQAMNYAVNKDAIVKGIYAGAASAMGQPLSSTTFGYNPAVQPYPHDTARAKQLLTDAGVAPGFALTLETAERYLPKDVGQAIASDLKAVGIDMTLNYLEVAAYQSRPKNAAYGHFYTNASGDGGEFLAASFTKASAFGNGFNFNNFVNEQVDAAIVRANSTYDSTQRQTLLQQAATVIHDEAPFIFLVNPDTLAAVRNGVKWSVRRDELIRVYDDVNEQMFK
jgi:peptide/nickel transport system substrate-binding protein